MEISLFPFLNQEEISHLHSSLFQDMNNSSFTSDDDDNSANLKRRKKDGEDDEYMLGGSRKNKSINNSNNSLMSDILTSLILLDEEEKQEHQQRALESLHDKAAFDWNHKRKLESMNDYHSNLQTRFSDLDEMDSSGTKRHRRSAKLTAAAVAVTETAQPSSEQSGTGGGSGQQRRLWVKDRSKDWWEKCNHPDFPEEEFRKEFRMSKATFDMICVELDSVVTKKNTMLRDAIPVRQRVAVCIWRLATGEPLRLVSKRFGLGISTCHKLVLEVCSAIRKVLMPKFLQWPDEDKLKMIKGEFESMSGIPNVGGSMYTTHVPITAPKTNVAAYYNKRHTERNQKPSYSMTVQGVVNPEGVFTDVCIGYPGSMPDERVLEECALFKRAKSGALKNVWIAGNAGHPLMDWVLVPYTRHHLTWTQHAFNEKMGEIQRVSKEAFARLKGRWTCLQKRAEVKLQDLPVVLGACCVLHNICEMRNEEMDPEMRFDVFDDGMIPENSVRSAGAVQARDHIAHNLLHHGLAGTSFL
ncbi:protein ALP [Salix suchowensis]|nr:protein ALP [Salix suchowensis]